MFFELFEESENSKNGIISYYHLSASKIRKLNRAPDCLKSLEETVLLGKRCSKSNTALSVGAVLMLKNGKKITGFSREDADDSKAHAEEIVLKKSAGVSLEGSVCFVSVSPCKNRSSKSIPCELLLFLSGVENVYFLVEELDPFFLLYKNWNRLSKEVFSTNIHHIC